MSFQHCVALVITIRDYLHLKPLPLQVSRDGHDVVAALKNKDIGQYEPENIVHVTDPTRKEFLAVMKKRVKKRNFGTHCSGRFGHIFTFLFRSIFSI